MPFVFAIVEDGDTLRAYWVVDRKPKRGERLQRLVNLDHDPRVEIVVDRYDEDWSGLWWVRATGRARVVTSDAERARGLAAVRDKYAQDAELPDTTTVVAIDVERVLGWSAADDR